MLITQDDRRIFGLLAVALAASVIFGYSLESATFRGEALGAEFYIGGPVAGFIILLYCFHRFHLFDQGLLHEKDDMLSHPIEAITSAEEIENMIIDLKAQSQRIVNRIDRLEKAKMQFDKNSPQAVFSAMGFTPARRAG